MNGRTHTLKTFSAPCIMMPREKPHGLRLLVTRNHKAKRQLPDNQKTRPLDPIENRNVLVLVDAQNIDHAARDLGYVFSYRQFGELLDCTTRKCERHAFFGMYENDERRKVYFESRGWKPYPYLIHNVHTCRGLEQRANVDNFLTFHAGLLVGSSNADTIVLCSGDGKLVSDIARAIAQLPRRRQVVTFSLPGSTAQELNADYRNDIHANIELGHDVMYPRKRAEPKSHERR